MASATKLPQEVINLIIDEVASEAIAHCDSRPLAALRTCSLVARSFGPQSRKYIFSDIDILVDSSGQKRAGRLLKILQRKGNDYLLLAIRSVTFTFDAPYFRVAPVVYPYIVLGGAYLRSKQALQRTLKKIGLENNNLDKLQEVLSRVPQLEAFTLGAQRGFYRWTPNLERFFLRACSSQSLRSLHLINLARVPQSMLIAALRSTCLLELRLSRLHNIESDIDGTDTLNTAIEFQSIASFSRLEKLEINDTSYRTCCAIWRTYSREWASPSGTMPKIFSSLKCFKGSVPEDTSEWEELGRFLSQTSGTLSSLEFTFKWTAGSIIRREPDAVRLSRLTNLSSLSVTAEGLSMTNGFLSAQRSLAALLKSDSSVSITSLVVDIYVKSSKKDWEPPIKTLDVGPGWKSLDEALSQTAFRNLATAVFNIHLYYTDSRLTSGCSQLERRLDHYSFLPRTSRNSSLWVEVNLRSIYTPIEFPSDYLQKQPFRCPPNYTR